MQNSTIQAIVFIVFLVFIIVFIIRITQKDKQHNKSAHDLQNNKAKHIQDNENSIHTSDSGLCNRCKKEIPETSKYCPHCGLLINKS